MDRIRIVVYKNIKTPNEGKQILIDPLWKKDQVLAYCSEALGIKGKKIFNENGNQLNSVDKISEGISLYISQGEEFQVQLASTPKSSKGYVICMLGTAAVGKSAITQMYARNKFVKDYDPTIEEYYKKYANIDNEVIPISILDTAGMEDYYPLIDEWIDKKDAFILVYSVEWADSLKKLSIFHDKILHRYSKTGHNKYPVVVIAANKIDSFNRTVSTEEGKTFADSIGVKYYEVSAATGTGINEVYQAVIRELVSRRVVSQPKVKKAWYENCLLL
jgi:GTPase KRas